jgi:hypothetical protein
MPTNEQSLRKQFPHTRVVGPSLYYHRKVNGKIVQAKIGKLEEGISHLQKRYAQIVTQTDLPMTPGEAIEMAAFLRDRWRSTRSNAAKRGIEVSMTEDDFYDLLGASGGRCQITGIPFSLKKTSGAKRRAYAPSIDRIDSSGPYSKENCRVILCFLNLAMNEWGLDVLAEVAGRIPASRPPSAPPATKLRCMGWGEMISLVSRRNG